MNYYITIKQLRLSTTGNSALLTSRNPVRYDDGKIHGIIHEQMHITELARRTGGTIDQIRYLERKRYIEPSWVQLKNRHVRDYPESEVHKVEIIVQYLHQGFRYDAAYQKAIEEMQSPRLI